MKTKVQKWGNSLALRIPKAFAAEVGLTSETAVEVTVMNQKIIIEPVVNPAMTLEQLLKGITKQNLHAEVDIGSAKGNEAW